MSNCDKCNLVIDGDAGSARCSGCNKRFHFGQCSVSASTWRAKGQPQRDEWRCKTCIQASKGSKPNDITPEVLSENPADMLKSIQDSFGQFVLQQDKKFNNLKSDLKSQSADLFSNLEKLLHGLVTELKEVKSEVKTMVAQQKLLTEEKNVLKTDLIDAKKRIAEWELKMSQAAKQDTGTPPTYANAIHRDFRYQQNDNHASGDRARVSKPHTPTRSTGDITAVTSARPQMSSSASRNASAAAVGSTAEESSAPAPGGDVNGWRTANYRRKRTDAKIGKKSLDQVTGTQSNLMAAPRVQTSAMFVSRFSPTVSSKCIADMVQSSANQLTQLKVTKLKCRHADKYSSFHVEVLLSEFEQIDDVSIWPDGCLMKPFNGRLKPEFIVMEDDS